eukprot:5215792-Prymnesium_polylepis.1
MLAIFASSERASLVLARPSMFGLVAWRDKMRPAGLPEREVVSLVGLPAAWLWCGFPRFSAG